MDDRILIGSAIVSIALFFILRSVMLWYWKINRIEELLEEQVKIMKLVYKDKLVLEEPENENDVSYIEGVVFTFPENLEVRERELIEAKSAKLLKGQLLAFDTYTKRIDFFEIPEYHKFIKTANRPTLRIVAIKE
ncbi:MAG: hypothetical protein IPF68_11705 [Bacteroidales bacterium]|nr:hypothetical protein [Bacteroidales bacterium]